jgi:hypothetical protein
MKNVVWWAGVKTSEFNKKYGGHDWIDISKKSWQYWCKQNNVEFVAFEEPIESDVRKFRINWQKSIFVFDELERRGIEYDQICLVDASSVIKWDAPNFFELTDHKFCAVKETDNMKWMLDSIKGYQPFFGFKLDSIKYFSSGFLVFNKAHKELFRSFKQLYYDNVDTFVKLQDEVVRKGTEQTPLNYWVQQHGIDVKFLSPAWKLTHINRKEMFHYNWQLQEDNRPFFEKYGYVWFFTGLAKEQRSEIMRQVWDRYGAFYSDDHVLNKIKSKHVAKYTTSQKFKEDLLYYFSDPKYKQLNVLELGSCRGDTTRVLAERFNHVYGYERDYENIEAASSLNRECSNVTLTQADVYSNNFKLPDLDIHVVFIDAGHTSEHLRFDIDRIKKKYNDVILIFDDYGQPDRELFNVINELNIDRYIGENAGFITANGIKFVTSEGVICNMK